MSDLQELLHQLAYDKAEEKFIVGKYSKDVDVHLLNAYTKWQLQDGPATLEALLTVEFIRLNSKYERKLEDCKTYLRNFRKNGAHGFTLMRYEIVTLNIKVIWATYVQSQEEIINIQLHRDPNNQYTIPDGELMRQLEKLVPFQHWHQLSLTALDETTNVYDNEEDVNFGQGTAMRRLAREQKLIFGGDPQGIKEIKLQMHLNADLITGKNLRKLLGRSEIARFSIIFVWKEGDVEKKETRTVEVVRDPHKKYEIPANELMQQLESLVPFKYWFCLSLNLPVTQTWYEAYDDRQGTPHEVVMQRVASKVDDLVGNDPEGKKDASMRVSLNVNKDGASYLQMHRETSSKMRRVGGVAKWVPEACMSSLLLQLKTISD